MNNTSSTDEHRPSPPVSAALAGAVNPSPADERRTSEEALERLVDRTLHEALQRAGDLRKLSEVLTLLLQRLQLHMLHLEGEIAAARAEHSRLERALAEQRERVEMAAWELHQREREVQQARERLGAEIEAERAAAHEEARRIRAEAEQEAAALLAEAQRRRTELLASLTPGAQLPESLAGAEALAALEPAREAPAPLEASAAPPAPPVAPAVSPAERAPAPAAAPAKGESLTTEVVFLRVPDARSAAQLEAAVASLPPVRQCTLREFERGRLVLEVEHDAGATLAEEIRSLESIDVRLTSTGERRVEFQWL